MQEIVCVGRNYADHAAELGDEPPTEPLLFAKFENTLIGPGETILLPPEATHVDAETELCVELGRTGRRIAEDDPHRHAVGRRRAREPKVSLAAGDVVVEVERIGVLRNPVTAERRS